MSIDGVWFNERGSRIELLTDGQGDISGIYQTGCGSEIEVYALVGTYDVDGGSLAYCVSWRNEHRNANASTAWVGQLLSDEEGEHIVTMWLRSENAKIADDVGSTPISREVYRREQSPGS